MSQHNSSWRYAVGLLYQAVFRLQAQIHFLALPDRIQIDILKSGWQTNAWNPIFCNILSKTHLEVVCDSNQISMCLSPGALDAQIGSQSIFCVTHHATHNDDVKSREFHHFDAKVLTDAYVITTATHADRLVITGHAIPIWPLANKSLSQKICFEKQIWFACSLNIALVLLSPSTECHRGRLNGPKLLLSEQWAGACMLSKGSSTTLMRVNGDEKWLISGTEGKVQA